MVRRHEKSKAGCCALECVLQCVYVVCCLSGIEVLSAVRWRGGYVLFVFEIINMNVRVGRGMC